MLHRGGVTCDTERRTKNEDEEREFTLNEVNENEGRDVMQAQGASVSSSLRSASFPDAGGGAPTGSRHTAAPSGLLRLKEEIRHMDPVVAALTATGERTEAARNLLKFRLEYGEQRFGRDQALREWNRILEEFCGQAADMSARGKNRIANYGKYLGSILERNGFCSKKSTEGGS